MTEKDTQSAGTPLWVKVVGIIALVVVVLVVVILIAGRSGHGPSRHTSEGGGPGAIPEPSPA